MPNVTIPDFELRGANARIQAAGVMIYWLPLVTDESSAGWEEYSKANHNWLMEAFARETQWKASQDAAFGLEAYDQAPHDGSRNLQQDEDGAKDSSTEQGPPPMEEDGFHPVIFGDLETRQPQGTGPYLPIWQVSPVLPMMNFLNFNVLNHGAVRDLLLDAIESKQVVMGQAHDLRSPGSAENTSVGLYNAFLTAGQYRHDTEVYQGDPTSNIAVPVFDRFGPNRTLGGVLLASLYWRLNFEDILPDTAKGVICVLENTLNQTFSYQIDGPKVTFLGPGDRHDPKYEHMVVSANAMEQISARASPENHGFDATPMNNDHCSYKVRVYPSQATEDAYVNNTPFLYTVLVASIFLFTSLIFIAYDLLLARRQRIIMEKAVQTSAIVSSLYPKQVRDRLFDMDTNSSGSFTWMATRGNKEGQTQDRVDMEASARKPAGRPIADLYENCTVLFSDIAGFTKWSSTRKPEDVFYLLEKLYHEFDRIAARRNVFK
jgi:Adenylate and Guanylate cyclase catalytic domain